MADTETMQPQGKVKINDKEYAMTDLSDKACEQLFNLRFAETEIRRLQAQLAVAQTARNAYQQALAAQLKSDGLV